MFYRLYLALFGWFIRWRNRYWTHMEWMDRSVCFSYPGDNTLHCTNRPELWKGRDLKWSIVEYPHVDGEERDGGWVRTVSYEDALRHLYTGEVPVWAVYECRDNADHIVTHFFTQDDAIDFCEVRGNEFSFRNLETDTRYDLVRLWT